MIHIFFNGQSLVPYVSSVYVNSQKTRHWATENPHELCLKPLHNLKVGVCCVLSGNRMIGPIFLNETVNTNIYLQVYNTFLVQLTPQELCWAYFQQVVVTCHTSDPSLDRICKDFTQDRTIFCKGLWPPRSPDLSP